MLVALEGIIETKNETILSLVVMVLAKMLERLKHTIFQYRISPIFFHLSKLLAFPHFKIVTLSAKNLSFILRSIDGSRHMKKDFWCILKKTNALETIIHSLQLYESGVQPAEYVMELVTLLKEIVWRWHIARYFIGSSDGVMEKLEKLCTILDVSITTAIFELYRALVLCKDVAVGVIKNRRSFVYNLLLFMENSIPLAIRIEAFRLCQQLTNYEEVCLLLTTSCGEEIIQSIVDAMNEWTLACAESVSPNHISLMKVACCSSAQMARWTGNHHTYFWKERIDKVLLNIHSGNYTEIGMSQEQSKTKFLSNLKFGRFSEIINSTWDLLGWLSMNFTGELSSNIARDQYGLNSLICSACSFTVDGMLKERLFPHSCDTSITPSMFVPVFKATLWMVFSPCEQIASQARFTLSELLNHGDVRDYLTYLLTFFNMYAAQTNPLIFDNNQILLRLIALACYSSLPDHQNEIIKKGGYDALVIMLKARLMDTSNNRPNVALEGHNCCTSGNVDGEYEESFLLCILQALSRLIPLSGRVAYSSRICLERVFSSKHDDHSIEPVLENLLLILEKNFSRQITWYTVYCLSFFGFYGFPRRFGVRMKTALNEAAFRDSQLTLSNKEVIGVHHIILLYRCPSLLPPVDSTSTSVRCLSSQVGRSTLEKLLEFVYMGFCQVEENDVQSLRVLAKSCGLKSLYRLLRHKLPLCSSPLPVCEFTSALSPPGHIFSDVILEARETEGDWSCTACQSLIPHVHAHKLILCVSSTYLHAMFQSGMAESSSKTIKVPLSWNALVKLLHWFYSGELPGINLNCTWINMDPQTQLDEILVYLEISDLAEMWCMDEVRERSINIVVLCLKFNKSFPIEILQSAFYMKQHEILKVAVSCLAPSYNQLRNSGELEKIDEELAEMLRQASVACSFEILELSD